MDVSVTLVIILFLKNNPFVCFATRTEFKIPRESTCNTKNVIYVEYSKKSNKQSVGSCIELKPQLRNYKVHIENKNPTCRIAKHFKDQSNDLYVHLNALVFYY